MDQSINGITPPWSSNLSKAPSLNTWGFGEHFSFNMSWRPNQASYSDENCNIYNKHYTDKFNISLDVAFSEFEDIAKEAIQNEILR